jgi:flagellar biosynthesis component FlhA
LKKQVRENPKKGKSNTHLYVAASMCFLSAFFPAFFRFFSRLFYLMTRIFEHEKQHEEQKPKRERERADTSHCKKWKQSKNKAKRTADKF